MNLSVGYRQVSRACALAGQAQTARVFGEKCVRVSQEGKLPPFCLGYAYEAAARAEAVAKDLKAAKAHLAKARALLGEIKDKEERELLEADLKQLGKIIPD